MISIRTSACWLLPLFALVVTPMAKGVDSSILSTPLEEEPVKASRVATEAGLQVNYIKADAATIVAYGGEFRVWYRLNERWDAGMGLQQVISIRAGGAAVLSNTAIKARYFLLGGRIPTGKRFTAAGIARVTETTPATSGLALSLSLDQSTFNLGQITRSYSGGGIMMNYLLATAERHLVGIGVGASRISNGEQRLLPMRAELTWQYFLE